MSANLGMVGLNEEIRKAVASPMKYVWCQTR